MKALLVVCACLVAVYAERKDYSGYKLIEVTPTADIQVKQLMDLDDVEGVDVWKSAAKNQAANILLAPNVYKRISKQLERMGMPVTVKNSNIQKAIDEERRGNEEARTRAKSSKSIVNTFPRHADVNSWLESVAAANPSIASIDNIGRTYEGRDMKVIKIGKAKSKWSFTEKPSIWINAGIHAREWLTVGTVVYMIERLVNDYSTNSDVASLVDNFDWYILPVANPDGYEYTHTGDRMWRKTRSPTYYRSCKGADPNRNFDFKFGVSGVSSNPCAITYPGPRAFSERCTTNIKNFILSKRDSMKLFMDIHAYSQMWLTPWAYGYAKPSDYSELYRVAQIGARALKNVNGRSFQIGTPPEILYAASGGSYDWAKGVAGVKYAYALELFPTQYGSSNGFVVSQSAITPSGKEIWAAIKAVVNAMQ